MDYEKRTIQRYNEYYKPAYEAAYVESAVGQTTKYEADLLAQQHAHLLTQRTMCQTDLYYLATEVFGMGEAKYQGRKIWYPPVHGPLCDEMAAQHDSLIHYSRFMLKSSISKIWVVQQILLDPVNIAIGMWSNSSARVRAMIKSIAGMLQDPILLELFPDRLLKNTAKWEKRNFGQQPSLTVTRSVPDEDGVVRRIPMDEAQIEVWGLDSTVNGRHYTHHFYDDIIDSDNTRTANLIEKTEDQWRTLEAMRSPNTIEKMIGTPWHQMDVYATAKKEGYFDNFLTQAGVTADDRIIYPFYTREFLDKQRRKLGEYLYSCQYKLDTRPRSHEMFVLPVPYWEKLPEDPKYYIAIDPSTGRSEIHDKTGIAVGCVSRSSPTHLYYVEADSYMLKPEEIADKLVELIVKYRPARVGIEYGLQYALQALINVKIDESKKTNGFFPTPEFMDIKTGGGQKALSKAEKIDRTFGALTRDSRAYFRPDMNRLFRQMATFNPNVQKNEDDILDACSMLVQTVEHFHQAHWTNVEQHPVGDGIDYFHRQKKGSKRDRIFAA